MAAVMHDPRNSRLTNTVGPAIRIRRLRVNMGWPRSKVGVAFASPTYVTEAGRRDQPRFKYRDPTHAAQVRGGVWPRCVVDGDNARRGGDVETSRSRVAETSSVPPDAWRGDCDRVEGRCRIPGTSTRRVCPLAGASLTEWR